MADKIKRIQVRIGSLSYSLITGEDELYTRQIAGRADEMIRRVMQNNPQLSQNMATVLALVNAIDDLNHLAERSQRSEARLKEIDEASGDLRQELQRLREQNWDLKKDLLDARNECRVYQQTLKEAAETAIVPPEPEDSAEAAQSATERPASETTQVDPTSNETAATVDGLNRREDEAIVAAAAILNDEDPAEIIYYSQNIPLHQTNFDEYLAVRPAAADLPAAERSADPLPSEPEPNVDQIIYDDPIADRRAGKRDDVEAVDDHV